MKYLETETIIDAPPGVVWQILIDLSSYSGWNPFVVEAGGTVAVGSRLRVRIQPPGRKATTFRPTVTAVEPERNFEWLGHLGVAGIFDGRHRYSLEPAGQGTRFVQSEEFRGIAVPLFARSLEAGTRNGFEAMNQSIKALAEAVVAAQG